MLRVTRYASSTSTPRGPRAASPSECLLDREVPESIAIVIPYLEPAAAKEQASTGRHVLWLLATTTSATTAVIEALYLHCDTLNNATSNNNDYSYDERRTAVHILE